MRIVPQCLWVRERIGAWQAEQSRLGLKGEQSLLSDFTLRRFARVFHERSERDLGECSNAAKGKTSVMTEC